MKTILKDISQDNKNLLLELCFLFLELCNNEESTRMNPKAIAISIGPTIAIPPKIRNDPISFMEASKNTPDMFAYLLIHIETILD